MKNLSWLMLGAVALPLLAAAPAVGNFSGTYTAKFYLGPSNVYTNSECITFTSTGSIAGFPDSGTWDSSTYTNGWGGNFVVDGRDLRWYGTYNSNAGTTSAHNKIKNGVPAGKGGIDDFIPTVPPVTANDSGILKMVAGCSAPVRHTKTPLK